MYTTNSPSEQARIEFNDSSHLNSTRSPVKAGKPAAKAANETTRGILGREMRYALADQQVVRVFNGMELVGPPGFEPGTDGL